MHSAPAYSKRLRRRDTTASTALGLTSRVLPYKTSSRLIFVTTSPERLIIKFERGKLSARYGNRLAVHFDMARRNIEAEVADL